MAVTRRGYIFGAFLSGVLSVLLIIVAVSSDSWIVSTALAELDVAESDIQYGLFRGELVLRSLGTPTFSTLFMTCLPEENACAVSCKTERTARVEDVRALAQGNAPSLACGSITTVQVLDPPNKPAVISFGFYISLLVVLFLQLLFAIIAAGLAIINSTKNPTEPMFGLPGCLWSNAVASVLGFTSLLMFGIYWAASGLKSHLALSYIAGGDYAFTAGLGYSFWLLLVALLCSMANVGLIELRRYLLERDPPPPVIKVENHSDGTIFLY
ncbi:uncharacterized protein LOC134750609 [Cydia strobilella]|uniref:uncharacterized protein LOC134750609 n=1 Tax=Cydia strobilella TaxID=1100964 RepID=UPI003005C58C